MSKKTITIRIDPALYEALKIEAYHRGIPYVYVLINGALAHDNRLRDILAKIRKGELEWNEDQKKPLGTV